jgi:hypothetical protein
MVAAWVVGILALGALAVATGTIGPWTAPVLAALLFVGFSVLVLRRG